MCEIKKFPLLGRKNSSYTFSAFSLEGFPKEMQWEVVKPQLEIIN